MMMSGLFDRFPKLRIILAHMGGGLMMGLPRLRFGHRLGYEGMLEFQKAKNEREPMEYVREITTTPSRSSAISRSSRPPTRP
jgi:predicted TIM-barrel fold metal-dependent hydrolase